MKQYYRFRMNFDGMWMKASTFCMGLSLLLLAIYYFGMTEFGEHGVAEILLLLCIPLALTIAFIVLLTVLRWDAPGIYGILGAVFCIIFLITTIFSGNVIRMALGAVWYILSAVVYLAVTGGYLPGKLPGAAVFAIAMIARILFVGGDLTSLKGLASEGSTLVAMAGLMFLPLSMIPANASKE